MMFKFRQDHVLITPFKATGGKKQKHEKVGRQNESQKALHQTVIV